MDVDATIKLTGYIVRFMYPLGMIPYRWDKAKRELIPLNKTWQTARWLSVQIIYLTVLALLILDLADRLASGTFNLKKKGDMFRVHGTLVLSISIIQDTHTIFWKDEIGPNWNEFMAYCSWFIDRYGRKTKKRNLTAFILTGMVGSMTFAGFFGGGVIYLSMCEYHFLAPLLPACKPVDNMSVFTWKLLMLLAQTVVCVYVGGVYTFTTLTTASISLLGYDMVSAMRNEDDRIVDVDELRKWKVWTHFYRCWQINNKVYNTTFLEPLLPTIVLFALSVHVAFFSAFLVMELSPMLRFLDVLVMAVLCSFYYCAFYRLSKQSECFKEILLRNASRCRTVFQYKQMKSFPSITNNIGRFAVIDKLTLFNVLDIIITYTMNINIMIGSY